MPIRMARIIICNVFVVFVGGSHSIAEQFQRANPLSAPRVEMNVGLGNTSYISIHQLKREVDSYKQRQQEIVSFDQVINSIIIIIIVHCLYIARPNIS